MTDTIKHGYERANVSKVEPGADIYLMPGSTWKLGDTSLFEAVCKGHIHVVPRGQSFPAFCGLEQSNNFGDEA